MKRKIIKIDESKCNGCGLCADACHEGAIAMVDGIAKLIRDDYCDGLGDCLPACPTGAITFEEREAAAYDEDAVKLHLERRGNNQREQQNQREQHTTEKQSPSMSDEKMNALFSGCAGMKAASIDREGRAFQHEDRDSCLNQWPVQIKLAPVNAPYFHEADLLIAADCTAFAYGDFHRDFMDGRITLVGCPKLDNEDYSEKLAAILQANDIESLTVVRMEVPCCSGLTNAVQKAIEKSGKKIPLEVSVISIDGSVR